MSKQELQTTINDLISNGKGILAADESLGTIGKRFQTIQVENTATNREQYRGLLSTTSDLSNYITGVILFEETLTQKANCSTLIPQTLADNNIVPGIKVDKGLISLSNCPDEKITQGLDGLAERLQAYKEQGARFAKWRNVYIISKNTPSMTAMRTNAEVLARYAAICQENGIVPIVEPEVLMDGNHTIEQCTEATEAVLYYVFAALYIHKISLEHILLKPNMVLPGKDCPEQSNAHTIAETTIQVLRRHVPAAVPSINFLSGGQSPQQATENLNEINRLGPQPWYLSFSYGRALQEPCLKAWQGQKNCVEQAQLALAKRAYLNGAATTGKYQAKMEDR